MTGAVLIVTVVLIALLASRMPVALAMIVSAGFGLWMIDGFDSALAAFEIVPHQHSTSFTLTTIPLFILMAEFLSQGTLVRSVFAAADAWLGGVRGGLSMATVAANAGFAALSGSSTAAVGSMARTTVPQMRDAGYDDRLSLGTVAASGTLAAMIPPSGAMIIFGALTETSIGQLFIAGILPGLLTAVGYIVTITIWTQMDKSIAPKTGGRTHVWKRRIQTTMRTWPAIALIVFVLLIIYMGIVTPTEAGAFGAVGGLIISVLFGGMRWGGIVTAIRQTVQATAMILLLIVGATLLGTFLTLTRVTQNLLTFVTDAGLAPMAIVVIVALIYLVLGTFLDAVAMMVLTLPITFPLIIGLGFDPIWFGIIVIKCAEVGLITPPFGMNVFVAVGSVKGDITTAFKGSMRFFIVEILLLILLLLFPAVSTVFTVQMS